MGHTSHIKVVDGLQALDYLEQAEHGPDLIFLDINMPRMNGWEFLDRYRNLDPNHKAKVIIIMLTTSLNPADVFRSSHIPEISEFETKPLTQKKLETILTTFF